MERPASPGRSRSRFLLCRSRFLLCRDGQSRRYKAGIFRQLPVRVPTSPSACQLISRIRLSATPQFSSPIGFPTSVATSSACLILRLQLTPLYILPALGTARSWDRPALLHWAATSKARFTAAPTSVLERRPDSSLPRQRQ